MAILLNAHQLKKAFGARPLFESLTFSIGSGERIGLIGPNGAGKSTLLRILAGQSSTDSGKLSTQQGLRVGFLEQVPKFKPGANVLDTVLEGSPDPDDGMEIASAYEALSKLDLSERAYDEVSLLSGGWKKRVALARELIRKPDLLLLDEPTNHLDLESILWLEELLARAQYSTLTITHDRAFLQKVSNRILELDPRNAGGLLSVMGDYATFLDTKEAMIAAQESRETRLRNTLRRETEWLRQGAKARTTKQQARINRAYDLADEVEELGVRNKTGVARLNFESVDRSPKKLIEAKGISRSYDGRAVVPKLDLLITPKTRLGLLGANGCGKSTLIRLLVGSERPDTGEVIPSDQLKVSYFEQNRDSLDPNVTLMKTVCPAGDHVIFRGQSKHVRSYLERFLFTPGQMEMQVGKLSGGEQSRLLLARLMLEECNVLILDEPTNDLDLPTLDVLEDVLQEFGGAVILVSHDRFFLDQIATQILAFSRDTKGILKVTTYASLSQWEVARTEAAAALKKPESKKTESKGSGPATSAPDVAPGSKPKKMSFKDQRELELMESKILELERKLADATELSTKPETLRSPSKLTEITQEMSRLASERDQMYARWSELEEMKSGV